VVLVSGGLGPTDDDRTREAIAAVAGVELVQHDDALVTLKERFARAGYTYTPNNARQAHLPRGATLLPNSEGTAPGFVLRIGSCQVLALPGVPHELKAMFDGVAAPMLLERTELALTPALIRSLNLFGLGESQIDHRLADLLASVPPGPCEVSVHYRATFPEVKVVLVVRPGRTCAPGAARELLARLEEEARARLGPYVYGADSTTFSDAVVAALRAAAATVALAESCTGGQIGDLITSAPGSSDVFHLGVVSYHNAIKERILGVPGEILRTVGAVSRECVEAMARGVRELAGATYGVATSGIAGPGGGSADKPVGTVHFAVAGPHGVRHVPRLFPFDRGRVKRIAAHVALHLLLHELQGGPRDRDPLDGRWSAKRAPTQERA
jgi:nicotinamide-nucleotide amidase